jgi:hypothetical protein
MAFEHTCWIRESPNFPDHSEFMEILPEAGRIVCSTVLSIDPIRNAPIAMAYRECAPGQLETQFRPDSQWTDNTYRLEGDVAIWNHAGGKEWPWVAISCDQLPPWFLELRQKALKRMDERQAIAEEKEETQQAGSSNGG